MLVNPRVGQEVKIWYGKKTRDMMPLQGKTGVIEIVSRGKPRNHGVRVDGLLYVVPCGNINKTGD